MAGIIFHVPHLNQVGVSVADRNLLNPAFPVYIYSSEDFIEPKFIKFRRLEPLSNYDLSEIEYKGNIYLVMRNKE